jgi:hypothetical protein
MEPLVSPKTTIKWSKIVIACGVAVILIALYQLCFSDGLSVYNGLVVAFQIPQIWIAMRTIKSAEADILNN